MLLSGEGVAKNEAEASAWYAASAAQGFPAGMLGLGGCYERGDVPPIDPQGAAAGATGSSPPPNLALASFWYEAAAVQGSQHAAEALERLEAAHLRK
jgi:TPR repeat protein